MNIKKEIMYLAIGFSMILLSSCNFNENYCTRYSELSMYCDLSDIEEPPIPEFCHVISYGNAEGVGIQRKIFTQDTLRWVLQTGSYDFIFFSGNYKIDNIDNYHEVKLVTPTIIDSISGNEYIIEPQMNCITSRFSEEIIYQQPKTTVIKPTPFLHRINIRLKLEGQSSIIKSIETRLSGVSTGKTIESRSLTGNATAVFECYPDEGPENSWKNIFYAFGFNANMRNVYTINLVPYPGWEAYAQTCSVDLTPYLRNITQDVISLEMTVRVSDEIIVEEPIIIDKWEDYPDYELKPNK